MTSFSTTAAMEHLLAKHPLTRFEAITLYGVQDLQSVVRKLRRERFVIKLTKVEMSEVIERARDCGIKYKPLPGVQFSKMKCNQYELVGRE